MRLWGVKEKMNLNRPFIAAAIIWLSLAPISWSQPIAPKLADYETYLDYIGAYKAYRLEVKRYNEIQTELAAEEAALWSKDVYNIDSLRITVKTRDEAGKCVTGGHHIIELKGVIGPDSSFAMERLLSKNKNCYDKMGVCYTRLAFRWLQVVVYCPMAMHWDKYCEIIMLRFL